MHTCAGCSIINNIHSQHLAVRDLSSEIQTDNFSLLIYPPSLGGISDMKKTPDLIFVIDVDFDVTFYFDLGFYFDVDFDFDFDFDVYC